MPPDYVISIPTPSAAATAPPAQESAAPSPAHLLSPAANSPAQASPSQSSDSSLIARRSSLSARDRELLKALDDPSTIDPVEYAEWVKRSEVREAIAARDELRARQEHVRLSRFRDRVLTQADAALDTLSCHRQALLGDSLPSPTASPKLVGAERPETPDRAALVESRRAAR